MKEEIASHEEFLTIYNELDRYMRDFLHASDGYGHNELLEDMAEKNIIFNQYLSRLKSFARLRNAIVHNPYRKRIQPIAEPHESIVNEYQKIKNYVINPPKAYDETGVSANKLYTTTMDMPAIEVMKIMNEKVFTHVPIIEDGVLVGVFSENTIFSYMANEGDILLERDVEIEEFKDFLLIGKHDGECFEFMSRDSLVIEVQEKLKDFYEQGKRLAAVFLTHRGQPNEKILKMITAWDIASHETN